MTTLTITNAQSVKLIAEHQKTVEKRNKLAKLVNDAEGAAEIARLTSRIGTLAQIHNPRIAPKAIAGLVALIKRK